MIGLDRISRREFFKNGLVFGAGAAGLAAGYAAVPDAFARAVYFGKKDGVTNDRVIVMIQLAGGNDGFSTVIPLQDAKLRDVRPSLAGQVATALPLDREFGFNASLKGLKALYDQGKVAVVQGVGYPQPSLSHFDGVRIWETADPLKRQQDGWLGRTIDKNYDSQGHPLVGCACGATAIPGALRDVRATLTVVNSARAFAFQGGADRDKVVGALYSGTPGIYGALFDTAVATARDTVAKLRTAASQYTPRASYNDNVRLAVSSKNQLAAALQLASELIVTGLGPKVIHVTLGGFDTHERQAARQDSLLAYLDSAVSAFYQDLKAYGMSDRVLVATWSEFGRRPRENANQGTDHGTASPVLLVGDTLQGGLYGRAPSLSALDAGGNVKHTVDFRSVYQAILEDHLGVDAHEVLGQRFDKLAFVKSPAPKA